MLKFQCVRRGKAQVTPAPASATNFTGIEPADVQAVSQALE
jgi:hypothetical protein